ncbi:TVP38/TMEM64 family membrane protein [Nymphaea thermarum]|nr:TVP38/TMEM64 family membrane protein [Nymphaea thermarum]
MGGLPISWSSALRLLLALILPAAITVACITLPTEKVTASAFAYIPLTVFAVPASILTLGGGYLFGLPIGFVADSVGATVGATAAFLLGKTIGRPLAISKLKDCQQFQAIDTAIQRSGFKIVLLLRLAPLLPFNMLNYLLSMTPVSTGEYMMASWLGMMPITLALVYVGTTLKDLSDTAHDWNHISTILALMVCVTKVAKSSLEKALMENEVGVNDVEPSSQLPVSVNPSVDLYQPLIIKIDPSIDGHEN